MALHSPLVGNAAGGFAFPFKGKEYAIRCLDDAACAEFERRSFTRALRKAEVYASLEPPEDYKARLDGVHAAYEGGQYAFEGARGMALLQTPSGVLVMIACLCGCTEMEAMGLLAEHGEALVTALRAVLHESMPVRPAVLPAEGEAKNR